MGKENKSSHTLTSSQSGKCNNNTLLKIIILIRSLLSPDEDLSEETLLLDCPV